MSKTESEKQEGRARLYARLPEFAPTMHELMRKGYSAKQIYEAFPVDELDEIDIDQKTFIRKLRTCVNRYKKAMQVDGMTIKTILAVTLLAATLSLTACGGGGGSTTPTNTTQQLQNEGAALTPDQVAATAPSVLAGYDPAKIAAMSVAAVQAISPAAVPLMSPAQIIAMGSVSAFTDDQTSALSFAQKAATGLAYLGITKKPTITVNSVTPSSSTYVTGYAGLGVLGDYSITYDMGGVVNTPATVVGQKTNVIIGISSQPTVDTTSGSPSMTVIANMAVVGATSAKAENFSVPFGTTQFEPPTGFDYSKPAYLVAVACIPDLSYILKTSKDTPPQICSQASTPLTITQ